MVRKSRLALITGGAGFIGSHLVDALLKQDFQVVAADNFISGRPENLAHLKQEPGFRLVNWDVTTDPPAEVKEILPKLDYLFHLASPASPSESSKVSYLKFPEETAWVNTVGTCRMLEIARRSGAKLVYASTSEIYGDPKVHPQTENYAGNVDPLGPRACYHEAKRMGETWVKIFTGKHQVDGRIVRIFNTYGPRLHPSDGRVVSTFILQALRGEPLTVHGQGDQTRSFCYITDLISGLLAVIAKPDLAGEVFNLGRPEEYSILEVARIIKELVGSSSEITFTKAPKGDPTRRQPDIGKAKRVLGWEPKVSFREGLKLTIDYFKKLR